MCCWCVGRSGADTTGLGSGLAEVAGNDCYGVYVGLVVGRYAGEYVLRGRRIEMGVVEVESEEEYSKFE